MVYMLYVDAAVLFFFVTLWYLVSLAIKRQDIADVLWGAGCVIIVLTSLCTIDHVTLRSVAMSFMVIVWGSRLSTRIFLKNRGKPEDFRYRALREAWGRSFALRSYFQVFLFQAFLMFVILTPVLYVIGRQHAGDIFVLDVLGVLLWLTGFVIESVADYQLDSFKHKRYNRGQILQSGLWRYSRHPNYFGEVVMWWGLYCIALSVPGGSYTAIGPLVITFLILKVSGIPLIEKRYKDSEKYQRYKKMTSSFIPLPPRTNTKED
ncbi:DUF1295 domain-containing protein [Desulfosediminicola flagellatus]|uniref:DUF1295 domain-containing protein n=1 Tax=Desulfosediminicola flagellatus TaxID=2569541 RepID=UPI0010AD15A6|nr:DUF1295 domain-containing protein [Desulfosediminicola flagellatus]